MTDGLKGRREVVFLRPVSAPPAVPGVDLAPILARRAAAGYPPALPVGQVAKCIRLVRQLA